MQNKRVAFMMLLGMLIVISVSAQSRLDSLQHLSEVVISGNTPQNDNLLLPQTGTINIKSEKIIRQPSLFGEPDIMRTIQSQAGVSGGTEGFSGLFVRGGESDENLFLLHHLPVFHKGHLGGLFSAFNVAAVDKVDFYKANFPAQYGGRVSSITDIQMPESNYKRYCGQFMVGLLSGNAYATGPIIKDHLAFSAGIRRSWTELITIPIFAIMNHSKKKEGKEEQGCYALTDVNLKIDFRFNTRFGGFTHYYRGADALKLGEEKFYSSESDFYDEKNLLRLNWISEGGITGFHYALSANNYLFAKGYYSRYASTLSQNNDEEVQDEKQYNHRTNKNSIEELGFAFCEESVITNWLVSKVGIDYAHQTYQPEELTIKSSLENKDYLSTIGVQTISGDELAVWTDHMITPSDKTQLRLGMRYVVYVSEKQKHTSLEPRIGVRLSLCNNLSIKAGYMRVSQFVQQVSDSYVSLPTESWVPIGAKNKPLWCDQISGGIYGNLPFDCYFSVEGYYKWMKNLLEYKEGIGSLTVNSSWDEKMTSGVGWTYGADISIHRDKGRLTGSINYGLLWNKRKFEELNGGITFPGKYDSRHKININGTFHLNKRIDFNMAWTYMTGNMVTLALQNYKKLDNAGFTNDIAPLGMIGYKWGVGYYPSRNNVRLPAYHRLDVGISWYRNYPNGRQGIWNFSIYNLYSRINPVAIRKDGIESPYGGGSLWSTSFQTVGFLPIIPSVSYTLKL